MLESFNHDRKTSRSPKVDKLLDREPKLKLKYEIRKKFGNSLISMSPRRLSPEHASFFVTSPRLKNGSARRNYEKQPSSRKRISDSPKKSQSYSVNNKPDQDSSKIRAVHSSKANKTNMDKFRKQSPVRQDILKIKKSIEKDVKNLDIERQLHSSDRQDRMNSGIPRIVRHLKSGNKDNGGNLSVNASRDLQHLTKDEDSKIVEADNTFDLPPLIKSPGGSTKNKSIQNTAKHFIYLSNHTKIRLGHNY